MFQVSEKLNWNEKCSFRKRKSLCAFFNLKRNISQRFEQKSKLHAFLGYFVPMVTYCSQAWFPKKSQMKIIEKLQKIATKWILSEKQSYKQRLVTLNFLHLSLYIEMHELLYLIALKQGIYDVELPNLDSIQESTTRQHSRGELQINKNRLIRSDENFSTGQKFYILVLKVYSNYGRSLNKNSDKNFLAFFLQSVHRGKQMHLAHCMQVWILSRIFHSMSFVAPRHSTRC